MGAGSVKETLFSSSGDHGYGRQARGYNMKVGIRLPGKGNSNAHGARPVHQIISMIKWIRTSRLSIKNSLSRGCTSALPDHGTPHQHHGRPSPRTAGALNGPHAPARETCSPTPWWASTQTAPTPPPAVRGRTTDGHWETRGGSWARYARSCVGAGPKWLH